jgi:exosortase A
VAVQAPHRCEAVAVAAVLAVAAGVLLLMGSTTLSMLRIWSRSATYSHGFLILPAFAWLVWQRRTLLAGLDVRPAWWAQLVLAAAAAAWWLGEAVAAALPTQLAAVAMVSAALAALLGMPWVRALAFPLLFLFLAVPFGDALVPRMTDWTADFTVAALRLSGVPVYREGAHFATPSGNWSVVEACSGIRYLFACVTVAALFAWSWYRTTRRRVLFLLLAVAIVLVANWVRAYAIVMLAHASGNRIAVGVDHVVYGALFFGVVMALVFVVGTLWREPAATPRGGSPAVRAAPAPARWGQVPGAALVGAVLIGAGPWWSARQADVSDAPAVSLRMAPPAGWIAAAEPPASWRPSLSSPRSLVEQAFERDGRVVLVRIGLFARAQGDAKLASSANRLVPPEDTSWREVERSVAAAGQGAAALEATAALLAGPGRRWQLRQWYWVGGRFAGSPNVAALAQALARLRGRSELGAWIAVATPQDDGAAAALDAFVGAWLESLDAALRSAL